MAPTRIILSGALAGLAMWLLAGLWHEIVAAHFYAERVDAGHQGLGIILAAYLMLGLLMAFMFERIRGHGSTSIAGLIFGALIGVVWVLPHGIAMAGAHGEPVLYEFQNAAWHVVEQGLGGLIIGAVHRRWPSPVRQIEACD